MLLVLFDCEAKTVTRFVEGVETHRAAVTGQVTKELIESFRINPPKQFTITKA
jgi:hypothetical protein